MAADELPEDQRLKDLSPKSYEHPADRAATAALQQIPMMDTVVRKLIEFGERSIQQQLLAGAVRLGPDQLPEIWASHRAALARLDIDFVPDLYMWQMPFTNAMAIGSKKPMVVLNSGAVSLFDEHEMRTVLGHEAGHILSDHLLYRTALLILLQIGVRPLMRLPFFAGPVSATGRTMLVAGLVLAVMILPIITAVSREVFRQTPKLHEEAALALGATRWEMIRMAVLPFGRSGVVSGAMLGLGRALGETMAVAIVLSVSGAVTVNLVSSGNPSTIAANIALQFPESSGLAVNALIASGLVLFVITLLVNAAARAIVNRRREFSGAN